MMIFAVSTIPTHLTDISTFITQIDSWTHKELKFKRRASHINSLAKYDGVNMKLK